MLSNVIAATIYELQTGSNSGSNTLIRDPTRLQLCENNQNLSYKTKSKIRLFETKTNDTNC